MIGSFVLFSMTSYSVQFVQVFSQMLGLLHVCEIMSNVFVNTVEFSCNSGPTNRSFAAVSVVVKQRSFGK